MRERKQVMINGICPCPNPNCPNHGDCEKCTSSHLAKRYLSYCAFHTILPNLQKVIEESPDSVATQKLKNLIDPQLDAYEQLKAENGIEQTELDEKLKRVAEIGSN